MYADAGDVYCVYNFRLKQYTACQVTRVEEHGGKKAYATLLALDWQGNKPLGAAELADLKPLYKDFMYWERGLHMYKASAVVPTGYVRVGNTAPLVGEDTQRYASFWGDGYDVYRQLRWQQIPEKQRKAFKKAAKSKKTVMFAGREYGISKQNLSDVWDDFEDAMELKAFPCLSSLFLTKWHKNLYYSGLTKTSTRGLRLSSRERFSKGLKHQVNRFRTIGTSAASSLVLIFVNPLYLVLIFVNPL
ncbi:Uncharacterised protein [Neisseria meningitidis]|nr:Uncharacterised protein [Neisseria meningitidis]